MLQQAGVDLSFQGDTSRPDVRAKQSWPGFSVETVRICNTGSFDYKWYSDANYLARHDIALADGEIAV